MKAEKEKKEKERRLRLGSAGPLGRPRCLLIANSSSCETAGAGFYPPPALVCTTANAAAEASPPQSACMSWG